MFFRCTYIIKPIPLDGNHTFQFDTSTRDGNIRYELKRIAKEELKKHYIDGDVRCLAVTERPASEKKEMLFKEMTRDVPPAIAPLVAEVGEALHSGINKVISIMRWNLGLSSLHNFVRWGESLQWSFDGDEWKTVPGQISLNASVDFPIPREDYLGWVTPLQELIASNAIAPLGHELFSEAWAQRLVNRRSSLIIGMASLETAFKECASNLMPDAKWLIKNLQSPPLVKMLREYLPTFPAKLLVKGKVLSPPEEVVGILIKGIKIRNDMVHGLDTSIRQDTLEEVLRAIRDVLYLLDYYSGFDWAQGKISHQTFQHLIRDSNKAH